MPIQVTPVNTQGTAALGLEVTYEGGEFVMVVARKGLVSCGIVDRAVMDQFGEAVAIAKGTPEKHLITVRDLLSARIVDATEKAKEFGVRLGMTGNEALEKLSTE